MLQRKNVWSHIPSLIQIPFNIQGGITGKDFVDTRCVLLKLHNRNSKSIIM